VVTERTSVTRKSCPLPLLLLLFEVALEFVPLLLLAVLALFELLELLLLELLEPLLLK